MMDLVSVTHTSPVEVKIALFRSLFCGRVAGVYPLLQDEMCWFLAFDFDKRTGTTMRWRVLDVRRSPATL
jgi:hypothetical protein